MRSLSVHHITVGERTCELLSRLPELERLAFSFCDFDDGVLAKLQERFSGLMTFWPSR